MKNKKYFIRIAFNDWVEEHYSNSERYIRRIIKSMYDETGAMYERYWNARIFCNLPEYAMDNIMH